MRTKLFFIAMLFFVVLISGCVQPEKGATYMDGTYTAEGDKRQYGYENATVTIKDDKIVEIILRRLNADGTEVDYTLWRGQTDENGVTRPNLDKFRIDMANAMLEKQSANVDTISGATDTSAGWITAVNKALEQATIKK